MNQDFSRALREFQDYVDDAQRSGFQTFQDALVRLLSVLEQDTPLGGIVHRALPAPDFEAWYSVALSQRGGLSGGGSLSWPAVATDRVALQLKLLRRVRDNQIDLFQFCHTFLTTDTRLDDMVHAFSQHIVRPFARDLIRLLHVHPEMQEKTHAQATAALHGEMVSTERVDELRAVVVSAFDLRKLVRLCEELNVCYQHQCYFAVAMLTRALLDHVPPLFGFRAFSEVVSNYSWARSKRDAMEHLEKSARKIADIHLHSVVSGGEMLPNRSQVSFGPALDVLLSELILRLRSKP